MFNLKYYYILYSVSNQLFIEQSDFQAPVCDPKSRTKSFYLPSPPNYGEDRSSYDIERDGIFGHPLFYGYFVLFVLAYFAMDWLQNKEQRLGMFLTKKYKQHITKFPTMITGFFFLAVTCK
jgi:hypothetical protein